MRKEKPQQKEGSRRIISEYSWYKEEIAKNDDEIRKIQDEIAQIHLVESQGGVSFVPNSEYAVPYLDTSKSAKRLEDLRARWDHYAFLNAQLTRIDEVLDLLVKGREEGVFLPALPLTEEVMNLVEQARICAENMGELWQIIQNTSFGFLYGSKSIAEYQEEYREQEEGLEEIFSSIESIVKTYPDLAHSYIVFPQKKK